MATETVQQKLASVTLAVRQALHNAQILAQEIRAYDDRFQDVRDGTHRFVIHLGQAIFLRPKGFFVNREEDRKRKLEENAESVKVWDRFRAFVTPDGFEIREH